MSELKDVIECKPGDRIFYTYQNNGYPHDIEWAKKHLTLNQTYVIEDINIGGYSSSVYIGEPINKWFNTVMFEVVK